MKIITKDSRDTFLRTKNRFYQCGWLDAERNEPAQASTRSQDESCYNDYLVGYSESMDNAFAQEGI
jgi:hypothetical protein